jgi:glycerophosphoryl diester phosphodiesterase
MFADLPCPVIFAHRGASAHAPENTLPAFELALQQGADGVELDAQLTADGHVIVIHDPRLERTTNGHGRVKDFSLADLRALDAAGRYSDQYNGTKIPTLDEVFETIGKKAVINIELKNYTAPQDALVEKVCQLVKRYGLEDRILFSSFFGLSLRKAARLLPQVPRGLLALSGFPGAWARSFGFMFGDYQAVHPHINDVNAQQVQRVHRLKRYINVWTVNSAQDVARLADWGVDGIITDDPLMAVRALGRTT